MQQTAKFQMHFLQCFKIKAQKTIKGEFQICPHMDLDNILYVEYLGYNNYKNEIILFLERC